MVKATFHRDADEAADAPGQLSLVYPRAEERVAPGIRHIWLSWTESGTEPGTESGAEALDAHRFRLRPVVPGSGQTIDGALVEAEGRPAVGPPGDAFLALELSPKPASGAVTCFGVACWALEISTGSLVPDMSYVVETRLGIEGTAPWVAVGRFATGSVPDLSPPVAAEPVLEREGGCLHLRVFTGEWSTVFVGLPELGHPDPLTMPLLGTALGWGRWTWQLGRQPGTLAGDGDTASAHVRFEDASGNQTLVRMPVPAPLGPTPAMLIVEILANPAGDEGQQEFVELQNVGAEPVDLAGFALSDGKGQDVLPAKTVAPGQRVLVVPETFDALGTKDPPPAAGVPLIRVQGRLGGTAWPMGEKRFHCWMPRDA